MSITREQVAELQPGDVVEYGGHRALRGAKIVGPIWVDRADGDLMVGDYVIRFRNGDAPGTVWAEGGDLTLTVVSRAPRPLFVNHPRTGDVVGDGDVGGHPKSVWIVNTDSDDLPWFINADCEWICRAELPARLRLLVDGSTGEVVQ